MARGFVYVVAIMDWYSRKVLSWRVSNSMDADFCVDALEEAISRYGAPDIFNTDQGAQFTSEAFTGVLKEAGIRISMDGKGKRLANCIYSGPAGVVMMSSPSTGIPRAHHEFKLIQKRSQPPALV